MTQAGAQIVHVSSFFPKRCITQDESSLPRQDPKQNDFFKMPHQRHMAFPEYSAADLGTEALKNLFQETETDPNQIELILYSAAIPDYVNIAIGPAIQYQSGASKACVLSIDTGCVSYISMLHLADALILAKRYQRIAIVTVTNFVSRLSDFQESPFSMVLGDGATATLIAAGKKSLLSCVERSHGEYYGLMTCKPKTETNAPERHYWEPNHGPLEVQFSENMLAQLKYNAVTLVTDAVLSAIQKANVEKNQIRWLLTHQPNMGLIQKWREQIGILPPRVFDTFHLYGNLFQSSIPATIAKAIQTHLFQPNDLIAMGTFANGGDFSGSAVIQWQ